MAAVSRCLHAAAAADSTITGTTPGTNPCRRRTAAAIALATFRTGKAAKLDSGKAYRCGSRKTCRQIASCEEAYYLLHHCGLSRLNRNSDGIPCESLCQ